LNEHAFVLASSSEKSAEQAGGPTLIQSLEDDSPVGVLGSLPRIESAVLDFLNIIFRQDRRISFEWPDGSLCTVVLLPEFKPGRSDHQSAKQVISKKEQNQGMAVKEVYRRPEGAGDKLVIEARLGRHSISIALASTAFVELMDGENAALLPPEIKCALLESYLDDAVWTFEQAGGALISIDAVTQSPIELPDRGYNLYFELQRQEGRSAASGYLSLDFQGLACLASMLKPQVRPLAWDRIDHLQIPVSFVLANARLRLSQINTLTKDDIVLFDCLPPQNGAELSIQVNVAQSPFWLAKKSGNHLVVQAKLEYSMEENAKKTVRENEEINDLEDIELELVFELGRMSMPLSEVRRIGPGYTFDLAGKLTQPISISINGGCIGSGELVKIDNRLGVRLTRYFQSQDRCEC
jgi:type III secretion system YscQ/HrcQ family protein